LKPEPATKLFAVTVSRRPRGRRGLKPLGDESDDDARAVAARAGGVD